MMRRSLQLLQPLPVVLGLTGLVHCGSKWRTDTGPDLSVALQSALRAQGLETSLDEVHWLDPPAGLVSSLWARPRVVFRGRRAGEPADIYVTSARLTPEGRLLDMGAVYNLTDTSAVAEEQVTVTGGRIAYILGGEQIDSVHLADLRGEPIPEGPDWTPTKHWQRRITNLQETGQLQGVGRRSFKLDPVASKVVLAFSPEALLVRADSRSILVPTNGAREIRGARFIQEQPHHQARPGNFVTWAVDRVRNSPWFGQDRMQVVKAVAFRLLDVAQGFVGNVTGDDGSQRVKEEMGELLEVPIVEYTDPETGWPPESMETVLTRPLEGEGKWRALENDPFIRTNPGAPAPFVTSFLRVDRERQYDQIWVTVWDPRQVQLHIMSGTVEPKSATGETGPGLIPRKPEVMSRLLAGLNGGFQATHGEYGMMAEGVLYLPPKPYAATIALLDDGSNAFGTWPNDERVPPNIVSFRQNMSPMIQDDKINPYKRAWWGGVPEGWENESRTTRSGICMTKEKFIAYFYGASTDDQHLLEAMKRARCQYAIHLDMNAGHTGLEFYRAGPAAEIPPLDRYLDRRWEAQGEIPDMPGWRFRGRRMLRYMGLMNFPRYIDREARDFFYLTLRHVLPGDPLPTPARPSEPGEGEWTVEGLPQHGWPYAIATTWLRPDPKRPDTKVRLMKLDPRQLEVASETDNHEHLIVAFSGQAVRYEGTTTMWIDGKRFVVAREAPSDRAVRVANGFLPKDEGAKNALAGIGILPTGMVVYAEITTGRGQDDLGLLEKLFADFGSDSPVLLDRPIGEAVGGVKNLGGHAVRLTRTSLRLIRGEEPSVKRIFEDTPIVHPDVWYKLQSKRVRYFRKPE